MKVRGIRGATTVARDEETDILAATEELVERMMAENRVTTEDIAAIIFTMTPDLHNAFPARAVRRMGMTEVPLMCAAELDVEGGLPRCIRVLMLVNTEEPQRAIKHVYLKEARGLRPDLAP